MYRDKCAVHVNAKQAKVYRANGASSLLHNTLEDPLT